MRAGRKVALVCVDPWREATHYHPFNYAVRRVQAALLRAELPDAEVHLVESNDADADELAARLEKIDPDVVGASAYVWSFGTFVDLAERLKRARPDVSIVFGGPSARPAMFELPPYRERRSAVDALVLGEGEDVFARIVAMDERDGPALSKLAGLAIPTADGFLETGEPPLIEDLDRLPSPYEVGLAPAGYTPPFETYRGCPLSCSFCQWGDARGVNRVFSQTYLERELIAIGALGHGDALLVDAALNLNARAFRNLAAAEREVGVLKNCSLQAEVYPSHLTPECLSFLASVGRPMLGVGLQSYDKQVLRRMQRHFDERRFETVVRELVRAGADVTIEVILGLPGDSPDCFMGTVERALALGCRMRIYHCMVLPDALMTRAPEWADIRFDSDTLLVQSCAGWTVDDILWTSEKLDALCLAEGGVPQPSYWYWGRSVEHSPELEAPPVPGSVVEQMRASLHAFSSGSWSVRDGRWSDGKLLISVAAGSVDFVVELAPAHAVTRAFQIHGGVAVSYRSRDHALGPAVTDVLARSAKTLADASRSLFAEARAPLGSTRRLPIFG